MTNQVMKVPADTLANICVELPCERIQCEECVVFKPKPGDQLILMVVE